MAAPWRVARSLDVLVAEVDAAAPRRSKRSDGSIGDARHTSVSSDHNPDPRGVVRARDFTHDPSGGLDAAALAEHLRGRRDARVKYVISDRRIASPEARDGAAPWAWRPYTGTNPHTSHVHVSVVAGGKADDLAPWGWPPREATRGLPRRVTRRWVRRAIERALARVRHTG
jgi:hypothetical protein